MFCTKNTCALFSSSLCGEQLTGAPHWTPATEYEIAFTVEIREAVPRKKLLSFVHFSKGGGGQPEFKSFEVVFWGAFFWALRGARGWGVRGVNTF